MDTARLAFRGRVGVGVLHRRHAEVSPEVSGQVTLIDEAAARSNVRRRSTRIQHAASAGNAQT